MSRRFLVPGFVFLILIGSLLACGSSTSTSTGTNTGSSSPSSPSVTPTPTKQLKWTTTHTFTGNGTQKTPIFTVGNDWKILYTCTFQNISGVTADGALVVSVYGSDNTVLDLAINATCKNGVKKTTGSTEEHQGGSVYLSMDGTGDWTVQVQELK